MLFSVFKKSYKLEHLHNHNPRKYFFLNENGVHQILVATENRISNTKYYLIKTILLKVGNEFLLHQIVKQKHVFFTLTVKQAY